MKKKNQRHKKRGVIKISVEKLLDVSRLFPPSDSIKSRIYEVHIENKSN